MPARVFAYGSNLNLPHLLAWAREQHRPFEVEPRLVPALLPDHRLAWNYRSPLKQAGAANVERAEGEVLPGGLLTLSEADLPLIDLKEGHPHRYRRTLHPVQPLGREERVEAWVYEVTDAWRRDEPQRPRLAYLQLVIEGARALGLPEEHLEALRRTPHAD